MVVIRDEARIAKLKSRSQQATLVGFLFLGAGFVVIFLNVPNVILYQTGALILGWAISQIGMYRRIRKISRCQKKVLYPLTLHLSPQK